MPPRPTACAGRNLGGQPGAGARAVGSYDENMITAPYVLYDGERSDMWFSAVDFRGDWSINLATSEDGVRWTKHAANPLLDETHDERWDAVYLAEPAVLYDGQQLSHVVQWRLGDHRDAARLCHLARRRRAGRALRATGPC